MTDKALLFINGIPPNFLPELSTYHLIACTDGAFHYLKKMNFPLEKLTFISGDFDSFPGKDESLSADKFIHTPDQNKTDFQKALELLIKRGVKKVDIYGGSGGEMDHFLGNLTVAFMFKDQLELTFIDASSKYYFIPKNFSLDNIKGKMISLFPFPVAENIKTKGLEWPLDNEGLDIKHRIGTRNRASEDKIDITYGKGDLLIFIHH